MKKTLLVGMYRDPVPNRRKEYSECFISNAKNELIDAIYLFVESEKDDWETYLAETPDLALAVKSEKVTVFYPHRRMTFGEYLRHSNYCQSSPSEAIVHILANADIYFDGTLSLIEGLPFNGFFYCMTRTDGGVLYNRGFQSHDVWMWSPPVKFDQANFCVGFHGCDGAFAHLAAAAGLKTRNVGGEIHCIHHHESRVRRYSTYVGGPFLDVFPTSIKEVIDEESRDLRSPLR